MNHLAHALLAAPDPDVVFGSLIADSVRGRTDPSLRPGVRQGIALHRSVDTYTDAHPCVVAARALFEPPYRRYAGIFLDVWFDHLLARRWDRHGTGTLREFSASVQTLLITRADEVPERMRGFVVYLIDRDLPQGYRERVVIDDVLRGLSRRLSRANPLAAALPVIERHAVALDQQFETFFPDLAAHACAERRRLTASET